MKAKQRKKTVSLETNSIAVLSCTVLWCRFHGVSMEFPCSFHAGFMLVTCWAQHLHDNSLEPAWNLHGTSMEPASGRVHGKTNKCRWRHHLHNAHGNCMKPTSILHGTCMEPPWKLHQLEGTMQPSRLDTRNNGTYMKPPWNLHQFSMEPAWILHQRSAIQAPGVDTGNRDFFFSGHYVETIRHFDANWSQIDRKSIVNWS